MGASLCRGRIIWRSLRNEAKALKKLPLLDLAVAAGETQAQTVPLAGANAGREGGCPRHCGRDVLEGQSKGAGRAGRLGRGCQAGGCRGEWWDNDPHPPFLQAPFAPTGLSVPGQGVRCKAAAGKGREMACFLLTP